MPLFSGIFFARKTRAVSSCE